MDCKRVSPSLDLGANSSTDAEASSEEELASNHTPITFSNLPFEIRTGIYKLAVPLSRVLRMRLVDVPHAETGTMYAECISPPCIPTILHINHESRTVGLSIFKLSFGVVPNDTPRGKERTPLAARTTYWNPEIDTLYLPFHNPPLDHPIQDTKDFMFEFGSYGRQGRRDVSLTGSNIYHAQHILSHVRHIALPVNHKTRAGFGPRNVFPSNGNDMFEDEDEDEASRPRYLLAWLKGFDNLKSVTMLDDPFPYWYRAGEICLHEPDLDNAWGPTFQEREDVFVVGLERFVREEEEGWGMGKEEVSVEMLIVTNRGRRRNPGFCVGPEKGMKAEVEVGVGEEEGIVGEFVE